MLQFYFSLFPYKPYIIPLLIYPPTYPQFIKLISVYAVNSIFAFKNYPQRLSTGFSHIRNLWTTVMYITYDYVDKIV